MGFFDNFLESIGIGKKGGGGTRDSAALIRELLPMLEAESKKYRDELGGQAANPVVGDLRRLSDDIGTATTASVDAIRRQSALIPGLLNESALADTTAARVGAVESARIAAGGRGGLAFGGGAGSIAARAGAVVAAGQGRDLTNAKLQAAQIGLSSEQNVLASILNGASTRSSLLTQGAQISNLSDDRKQQLRLADLQAKAGLITGAGMTGLQGNAGIANRRAGLFGSIFGGGGG